MSTDQNALTNVSQMHRAGSLALQRIDLVNLFFVHLSISVFLVALGSVIPYELSIAGWNRSLIAVLFGFVTLMELGRVVFARLIDQKGFHLAFRVYLFGITLVILAGSVFSTFEIRGQLIVIASLFATSLGTAVVATVLDGMFAKSSSRQEGKVATVLQTGRLLGYAIGGIMIAAYYGRYGSKTVFAVASLLFLVSSFLSILSIIHIRNKLNSPVSTVVTSSKAVTIPSDFSVRSPLRWLYQTLGENTKDFLYLTLFYILFGLGFFAQDSVLEVFGREALNFDRDKIGRLTGIWGTATLMGVLVGGALLSKTSDRLIVTSHTVIAGFGIAIIGVSPLFPDDSLAIVSLGIFVLGYGGGAASTPSIARLVYYSRLSSEGILLIAIFGVITTLVRSAASFLAALVLTFSSFQILFFVEAVFLFSAAIPYAMLASTMFSSQKE